MGGKGVRKKEQEAVKTTIVGGRPPGSGKPVGKIPRGIEVLVKKASVDPEFKGILLDRRAGAAKDIDLALEAAEVAMLNAVPAAQLEAIISKTTVSPKHRNVFLGRAAALMIVALGASAITPACGQESPVVDGIRPERPEVATPPPAEVEAVQPNTTPVPTGTVSQEWFSRGMRPDRPSGRPVPLGIAPDRPERPKKEERTLPQPTPTRRAQPEPEPIVKGIRPDRPERME